MVETAYANYFWNLGNIVTGFSVTQILALMYGLGTSERFTGKVSKNCCRISMAIVVFTAIYAYIVHYCYNAETGLISKMENVDTVMQFSYIAYIGREFAIVLFAIIGLWAVLAHRDAKETS